VGRPRWDAVLIGLDRGTAELDARIQARTAAMFDAGLVAEVHGLLDAGLRTGVTARRALGYAQVLALLGGELGLAQAQAATAAGTRRYVRRQRSWFRRDRRISWFDAAEPALLGQVLTTLRS